MFGFFKKIITSLFSSGYDETAFQKLEKILYEADFGSKTVTSLLAIARKRPSDLLQAIRTHLLDILPSPPSIPLTTAPHVILIVGVNGSGKTTTLAKLAYQYRQNGKTVHIAAADTYRAAAAEQLEVWATKAKATITRTQPKGDPAAVVFDALASAKAKKIDVVLIDTAGRLESRTDLMHELSKIRRICDKQVPGAPHETLLILDATLGQNSLDQAKTFHSFTPLTGLILTKLDGSAKGGAAIGIATELNLPILWLGSGETLTDLSPFNPASFVESLL